MKIVVQLYKSVDACSGLFLSRFYKTGWRNESWHMFFLFHLNISLSVNHSDGVIIVSKNGHAMSCNLVLKSFSTKNGNHVCMFR